MANFSKFVRYGLNETFSLRRHAMQVRYKAGDTIAWEMLDGHVMAGQVTFVGYSTYVIRRVDGSQCEVAMDKCRLATPDDVLGACDFFQGK
jgi:hypothetical protein